MSQPRKPSWTYIGGGVVLAVFGLAWAVLGPTSSVTYTVVPGISAFAVLYVIAQGAERVTEWVVDLLSLVPDSPEKTKVEALRAVRSANSTLYGNPSLADFGPELLKGEAGSFAAVAAAATASKATALSEKNEHEKTADTARLDITFLSHGLSIAVCALAVNALNYGILTHVGASGVDAWLDRLLTALAAAGGTKALHELIGRWQQAKESAQSGATP